MIPVNLLDHGLYGLSPESFLFNEKEKGLEAVAQNP